MDQIEQMFLLFAFKQFLLVCLAQQVRANLVQQLIQTFDFQMDALKNPQ